MMLEVILVTFFPLGGDLYAHTSAPFRGTYEECAEHAENISLNHPRNFAACYKIRRTRGPHSAPEEQPEPEGDPV